MDLTLLWWLLKACASHTGGMRTLLAWTGAAALSVLLGFILYSTSLQGSQAGYQESSPLITESPSASTAIRQPESGMAEEVAEPAAPQVAVPPASQPVVAPAPVYTAPSSAGTSVSGGSVDSSKAREDREDHDDKDDD